MANLTGVRSPGLLRACGLRDMLSGLGILTNDRPAFWLWSRAASTADRKKIVASAAVLDVLCALGHSRSRNGD